LQIDGPFHTTNNSPINYLKVETSFAKFEITFGVFIYMNIFPAIDIIDGKAVRLERGDYAKMTVYSDSPLEVAKSFEAAGARFLHVVDLEGAKDGTTPNLDVIVKIISETSLRVEVGGGIRSLEVLDAYINAGVFRVILGTAAVSSPEFLEAALKKYGEKVAVGVDLSSGMVAIKGWREVSSLSCDEFFMRLEKLGVKTVICTDISKDGLLGGTNIELYKSLSEKFSIDIIASGGVSSLDDVRKLRDMNMYGAILGKAIYAKRIDLAEALALARGEKE